jgi:UPF0755 protein
MKAPTSIVKKICLAGLAVLLLAGGVMAFTYYQRIYGPSVQADESPAYFYLPTGSSYHDLLRQLEAGGTVKSVKDFAWVAEKMNLPAKIFPGQYRLENGMSNYALAALLRSGRQEPVKLVMKKFRRKEELVSFIAGKLETDSAQLLLLLNDSIRLQSFDTDVKNVMALFIPNTYQLYWNTDHEEFLERMKKESDRFWNRDREAAAKALRLSRAEVITLASIVEEETNYQAEKARIAAVYLNRLNKGMLLQADPTVKFALQNFELKRVLNVHLTYTSPYNTYLVKGLPPGPICTPSIASIEAVLQPEENRYYYFCANPDQPGTHVFAETYSQHLLNARRYQQWLNRQLQQR